jgi:hypothetical protein
MEILTVCQNYGPEVWAGFTENLKRVGYQGTVRGYTGLADPLGCSRMYAWLEYVKQRPAEEIIMLSDLRDVVFQDNPEKIRPTKLFVFLESQDCRIKDEPFNRGWILEGWGAEGLERIGDNPISCSGVTIGPQPAILDYLQKQCRYLVNRTTNGFDQGVHNWMVWNREIDCVVHDNNNPYVYTVGLEPRLDVRKHRIYNRLGMLPMIVHQADRHLGVL